jgi:hypothetical protein
MSIELLPPTPIYDKKYHVRINFCDCHPETCCCNDWAVHTPDGEKEITFYKKNDAQDWADFKNKELATTNTN